MRVSTACASALVGRIRQPTFGEPAVPRQVVLPTDMCFKLPDGVSVSLARGAMCEPFEHGRARAQPLGLR
ncbi:hypothetical protein BS78_04G097500 [Paspalum vaginatum]|nr:hypothetical protein BS78_04G097500 [Paspalum vaginatum]